MNILRLGNPKAKKEDKIKRFECEICGCIWQANKNEYKEDWSKYSIPVYCKCAEEYTDWVAREAYIRRARDFGLEYNE